MDTMNKITLPNKVYEEALHEAIENHLKKPINEFDITYSTGSSKGDGFVGELLRVKVNDKHTKESKMNLIVKLPPQYSARSEMFPSDIYEREALFYGSVYPMFRQFQKEKGINLETEGFREVPVCYKTLSANDNFGLFLEDLKTSGFDLHDRFKPLTANHIFLVMKGLAKMHAIGYAIKDQKPEMIEKFYNLSEIFIEMTKSENSTLDLWFEKSKEQTRTAIAKSGNAELIKKINAILELKFSEHMKELFDVKKAEPYATICHGDCWNNNMMFRFSENGIPEELRFLDFQVMRYFSPVSDLVYYIFGATEKPFRDEYYQTFLNVYYNELSSYMRRLGSDPDKLFPRHIFEAHLKLFGRFGAIMAVISAPFMTNNKTDIPDIEKLATTMEKKNKTGIMDENAFDFVKASNTDKFEERMLGICQDMHSLGYI